MNGIIFDIQSYAIYDGPGIRSLIFLKGCPLSCKWCQNPESQELLPQRSYFKEKCTRCGKCIEVCPNHTLEISGDYVVCNNIMCQLCGTCVKACANNVIEIIGENRSTDEIVELILRDKPFYDNSGGGVTISGGEPTMQDKFLLKLLTKLKSKNVHVAIETCGYFKENLREKLCDLVDLFLFDIKHIDSDIHKKYTGVGNKIILENFRYIHSKIGSKRIIPRIPLIPSVNDDPATILGIITFLKSINYSEDVHLMPYNKLAKTKYEKIGKEKKYQDMGDLTEDKIAKIVKLFESHSFKVKIQH